jgi:hypothetical protein
MKNRYQLLSEGDYEEDFKRFMGQIEKSANYFLAKEDIRDEGLLRTLLAYAFEAGLNVKK